MLVCREFEYDPQTRTAHYRKNAVLRSGKDEIRAPTIVIKKKTDQTQRLTATKNTTSTLQPHPQKNAAKPKKKSDAKPAEPAAVEARSRDMVYEEAAGRIVYTGDVEIRQGDILTFSPEAVVILTKTGRGGEAGRGRAGRGPAGRPPRQRAARDLHFGRREVRARG
jgi:lipopolysaccharide export system protein LptA